MDLGYEVSDSGTDPSVRLVENTTLGRYQKFEWGYEVSSLYVELVILITF